MKRNLVHSITISIIITLGTACMPKETDPFALKAQFVVGDVKVESAAGSRVPAPGDPINESDTVKTGPYSQIDMVYGERGFLRLQENSLLRVSELREKQGGGTGLSLDQGKIFVVVSKLAKGTSFSVKTPLTLAAVRGTSFRVSADAKTARIDVVAGKVTVNPVREGKVVEEVSAVVENSQAVELTPEKVAAVFEKKEAIPVQEISADVMTQIKNEVREVPAEVIKKLEPESVRELKQVVQPPSQDEALQKKKEADERARQAELASKQQQALADKRRRDDAAKREREEQVNREKQAAELAERERIARENAAKAEKARKEKEAKDRSSNIPTL